MNNAQPHLLMVDDEAAVRQLYTLYFETQGFKVSTAANAAEALTSIARKKFDVIILDIGLAETNGIDLVEPIKGAQPNVPILIFTGRVVDQKFREETLKKGVFSFLTKSHPLDYLVSEVKRAVRASRIAAGTAAS